MHGACRTDSACQQIARRRLDVGLPHQALADEEAVRARRFQPRHEFPKVLIRHGYFVQLFTAGYSLETKGLRQALTSAAA